MSRLSSTTKISLNTQMILQSLARKTDSRIYQLEDASISFKEQTAVWEAFGQYLMSQLRAGRATVIPKFGIFTFSWPTVNLAGTTNETERDKQFRRPVFLVSKDFVKGLDLKPGVCIEGSITQLNHAAQNGKIPQFKVNISEVAAIAKVSNDVAKTCIDRTIRELNLRVMKGRGSSFEIPYIGTLLLRNNIAAVQFYENLEEDVKESATKNLLSKTSSGFRQSPRFEGLPSLKIEGPEKKIDAILVDEGAQSWLKSHLDLDVRTITNRDFKSPTYNRRRIHSPDVGTKSVSNLHSQFSKSIETIDTLKNKLLSWMRNLNVGIRNAFFELAGEVHGYEISHDDKINADDLYQALRALDVRVSKSQSEGLFKWLDFNADGYVDLKDWIARYGDQESGEYTLKSLLRSLKSDTTGVMKKLGIEKDQNAKFDKNSLIKKFSGIENANFSEEQIEKIVETLLADKKTIRHSDLKLALESSLSSDNQTVLLIDIKKKIINALKNDTVRNNLMKALQEQPETEGRINSDAFLKILKKNIPLLASELETFTNSLSLGKKSISIQSFIMKYFPSPAVAENSLAWVANILKDHLKSEQIDAASFLKRIAVTQKIEDTGSSTLYLSKDVHKVSYLAFSNVLGTLVPELPSSEIISIAETADIDQDGSISKEDIETFISRNVVISLARSGTFNGFKKSYPTEPLTENQVLSVLSTLRIILDRKHISNYELFRRLDENEDGFLNIEEFSRNLDKIHPLTQETKDAFFAYIDKMHIGLIDYKSFLRVMQKSIILKDPKVGDDNFDWIYSTLKSIRVYFEQKGVNKEDAFRMVDIDFDGNISKEDLQNFLTDVLRMGSFEVTGPRLDRLFKLLDRYKRGYIQSDDFKAIFEVNGLVSELSPTKTHSFTATPSMAKSRSLSSNIGKSLPNFDWKANARQQIGLVLSNKFPSITEAFDYISTFTTRITYKDFMKWIDDIRALHGFNLTEKLLLQLFADLDPHKKGYLTLTDFENAFAHYNWNAQLLNEIQNVIFTNFGDVEAAFEYFAKKNDKSLPLHQREITEENFQESIKSLLPKRFSTSDIHKVWSQIVRGNPSMNFEAFSGFIGNNSFKKDTSTLASLRHKSPSSTGLYVSSQATIAKSLHDRILSTQDLHSEIDSKIVKIAKPEASDATFERLKQIIRSSSKGIYELFKEIDLDNSGKISPKEFKTIIQKLNVGLSGYEIDLLLDYCETTSDGYIKWMSFVDRIRFKESDARLFQRCKKKLKSIKENIYAYMLTPRDAFLQFSKLGSGLLTYDDFNNFIKELSKMSNEEVPAFSAIKDLFDFIDMKKDGVIDVNEWTQTFNQLTVLEAATADTSIKSLTDFSKNFLKTQKSEWENTKNYDEVMMTIGRNRKLIYNKFCSLDQRKIPITYEVAKSVLSEMLSDAKIRMEEKNWSILLKFAEQRGLINYKLLIDVYRSRVSQLACPPKKKVIYI